jgi:hypothetical protein
LDNKEVNLEGLALVPHEVNGTLLGFGGTLDSVAKGL